jgi:protein-S-isoprenylcysteine O-methyltransferase Ste14
VKRGTLLVAAQFALLAVLAAQAALAWRGPPWPLDAWAALVAGAALGAWALHANRPGNFNIRPEPRAGGRLVQEGPYRWIRHPMYSALLLGALGVARAADGVAPWLALAALAAVLWAKARAEEAALRALHPGYAEYQQRTRRFVPGLF